MTTVVMHSSGMTEDRQERARAQIASTARGVIALRGVAGASLRAVAREMGRTTGTITHHFRDRAELLDHVGQGLARRLQDRIRARPGEAPGEALRRQAVAMVIDEPEDAEVATSALHLLAEALPQVVASSRQRQLREDLRDELRWSFETLRVTGQTRTPIDPDREAQRLLCLMEGVQINAILDPLLFTAGHQREILLEHLSRLGIRG